MQSGVAYNHQTIAVDGEDFSGCDFVGCRMIYSGGEAPRFDGCTFTDCEWRFEDAAAQTLAYLKTMWSVGAKAAVQSTIKDITVVAR